MANSTARSRTVLVRVFAALCALAWATPAALAQHVDDPAVDTADTSTGDSLPTIGLMACAGVDCYDERPGVPATPAKVGHVDGVTFTNGAADLRGWTCQPGRVESNDVHVYVGGPAGIGAFVVGSTANGWSEPAVAAQCGLTGSTYRFYIPLFDDFRQARAGQALYVYAISPVGSPVLLPNSGNVTVPGIVNDAAFVTQTVPSAMLPGSNATVRVQMRNTGNTVWRDGNSYRLGAQNPIDNTTWGTSRVNLTGDIAPGATATFDFTVKAPTTTGLRNFQWRMVRDGVAWFGPTTPNVAVNVVSGAISASPNPCTIPWGASTCSTTVNWTSTVPGAEVWVTGITGGTATLMSRNQNGSNPVSWIQAGDAGARFHLKAGGWSGLTLATVDVRGTPTVNSAPTVSLTAPTQGQQIVEGSSVTFAATAADADDGVARVEFLLNGTKVGEDTSAPYSLAWKPGVGTHGVAARAFDTRGAQTTSASRSITVAAPAPPSIGDGGALEVAPDPLSDSVGATAAEFRVDESGAATYAIPLYAVPGTAGVAPKLSLRYSSQAGDGPLGRGWSIGGVSSVSRCRATREAGDFIVGGVSTDGTPSPIDFTSSDRYCLDGQRLIPAPAGSAACLSRGGMTGFNLRTEIESFQRVCAYTPIGGTNGVAFFTVERQDGSISWYGDRDSEAGTNRPDGYVNSTAPGKTNFALAWAQTRFQDSTGNYIDFVYLEDPSGAGTGEHLLSEVHYTGRVALAGQSTGAMTPYAKVMFTYEARPAPAWRRGYAAGGVQTQSRRLASITSCASAAVGCATGQQARFYALTYGTSVSGSGAELLMQVQECRDASRGVCLAPTTFAWSNASNVLGSAQSWDSGDFGSTLKYEGFKLGDIDGDGRQDLVWLKDGSSGDTCPSEHVMVSFGEIDGAGRQGFSASVFAGCTPSELMSGLGEGSWQLFDYTGDGRDDLFVAGSAGWMLFASRGRTAQPLDTSVNLLAGIYIPVQATTYAGFHPQLPDLNGDGLFDVVYLNNGLRARLMERSGNGWRWGSERQVTFVPEPPPACPPAAIDGCRTDPPQLFDPQRFGLNDFDGDAASDLVFQVTTHWQERCDDDPTMCGKPVLHVSMPRTYTYGVSHVGATTVEFKRQGAIPLDLGLNGRTVLGDFNGDGLTDVATGGSLGGPFRYALNSGAGFLPAVTLGALTNPDLVKTADVNGDGRSDLLVVNADSYGVPRYVVHHALPGGGFGAAQALPGAQACFGAGCDPRAAINLFLDLDADGATDYFAMRVFDMDRASFYVAQPESASRGIPRDTIVAITNGLGARTELTYAALNNPGVHLPDAGSRDARVWGRGAPVRDFKGPTYVAAQAASSSPRAGNPNAMARLHYRYAGAKVQSGGRGFLGFREIATIDPNRNGGYVVTTTTYSQNFPFIGLPASTVKAVVANGAYAPSPCIANPIANACYATPGATFAPLGGSGFSAHTQAWEADTDSAGTAVVSFAPGVQAPVHVRTAGTDERQRDPVLGVETSRVATTFDYGSHGNVVSTTVETFEGTSGGSIASVSTASTYGDDAARWRLGRLTGTTVTHRRPGRPNVVRTTAFEYAMGGAATGLLTGERQQPGTPFELRKVYGHDDFGNRVVNTMCAAPMTACGTALDFRPTAPETVQRYARTTYDSRGRYPVATIEPFADGEHATQTVLARDLFGEVLHARNANGVDTVAIPGALGRAYYSWTETVPGSAPGDGHGGAERITTYRWCGSGVTCPTGARFRSRTVAEGAPTQWTYFDVLGRPILQVGETFNVGVAGQDLSGVCTAYDASGNAVRVSNPFFVSATSAGMETAALATVCNGRASTVTSFDALGRPTDVVSPDGTIVSTGYAGLRTLVTDARGHTSVETRNGKGEVVAVTDAEGFTQAYTYNADGTLAATVRDAGGGQIVNAFTYDVLGRKVRQDDPDSGVTTFAYNALGELIEQQDAGGNRIEHALDGRGRVWRKTVGLPDGSIESQSTFEFDTAGSVGAPASEVITGTYAAWQGQGNAALAFERRYRYDGMGRPIGSTTTIDGDDYSAAVQYDALGRAAKVQDASGRWARTEFNGRGMPAAACESNAGDGATACPDSGDTYLRTLATDAWGNPTHEVRGNNAATMAVKRTHRADNGRLALLCAGDASCNLLREEYAWDANGNLHSQLKEGRYLETFEYDRLNRLLQGTAAQGAKSVRTYAAEYDALGNPCRKHLDGAMRPLVYAGRSGCDGLGGATRPHQVAQTPFGTETAHYHYDLRGNQTLRDLRGTANDRTIRYSADNRAHEIALGNGSRTRFWYGSDGQRYKRENGSKRTLYLGNVEIVTEGGVTTTRRTVAGVAVQTIVGGAVSTRYLFHDRLGSVVVATHPQGTVAERFDYEPFGGRRDPANPDATTHQGSNITPRGFTGHEMLDGVGVIHMNGRIYDPQLGRFLQPDPVIQAPFDPQSWNAYTYVFNNPLVWTDPSGMIGVKERQWAGVVVTVVAAVVAPYVAPQFQFVFAMGAGAVAGGVSTGSTQGALYGAFSAGLFYGVGTYFQQAQWAQATSTNNAFGSGLTWGAYGAKVLAHGAAGGVMARLQGGRFGDGFLAAGMTQAFAPGIDAIGNAPGRIVAAAIVGGTVSELSGGKFANGATTAAFSYAFNDALHGLTEDNEVGRLVHNQVFDNEFENSPYPVVRNRVGNMGWGDGYTDLVVANHIFEIKPISHLRSGYLYTRAFDQVQGYVEAAGGAFMRGNPEMLRGPTAFTVTTSTIFHNRTYRIQLHRDQFNAKSGLIFYSKQLVDEQLRSFWRVPAIAPSFDRDADVAPPPFIILPRPVR